MYQNLLEVAFAVYPTFITSTKSIYSLSIPLAACPLPSPTVQTFPIIFPLPFFPEKGKPFTLHDLHFQFPSLIPSPEAEQLQESIHPEDSTKPLQIQTSYSLWILFVPPFSPSPCGPILSESNIYKYIIPEAPSGYIWQRLRSITRQASLNHHTFLRSREGNRIQGLEHPPSMPRVITIQPS